MSVQLSMGRPGRNLAPFVETFIHYTAYSPEHRVERLIPDGAGGAKSTRG